MSSNKCRQCGLVNFPGATACRRCNTPVSGNAEGEEAPGASSQQAPLDPGSENNRSNYDASLSAEASLPSAGAFVSPYAPGPKLRTGQAVTSLVLGIFGLFSAGLIGLGSLIGLVLGIRAALNARNKPYVYGAKGIAIGGIVTNSLGLLSIIPFAIFAAIVIPNLMRARMVANESMAIEHMGHICTAEATFQSTVGKGQSFADMQELIDEGLLPVDSANKYGYQFKIRVLGTGSENGSLPTSFEALAVPKSYGSSGRMSFYTSEAYVVTYADREGKEAKSTDDPIDQYYEELTRPFARRRSTS